MTKKHLPVGDNHPKACFIGAEVPVELYERFTAAAKQSNRSRSGLIRHLVENADLILSGGDNHPPRAGKFGGSGVRKFQSSAGKFGGSEVLKFQSSGAGGVVSGGAGRRNRNSKTPELQNSETFSQP